MQPSTSGSVTTRTGEIAADRSIRIASWLFLVNGVAWGLGAIPYAIYISNLGRLPMFGSIRANSGPVSDQFGWEAVVWFLIPMGLLAWVEALTGCADGVNEVGHGTLLIRPHLFNKDDGMAGTLISP